MLLAKAAATANTLGVAESSRATNRWGRRIAKSAQLDGQVSAKLDF